MENINLATRFDQGNLYVPVKTTQHIEPEWYVHPKFQGVYLKNLITGRETEGSFSTHLVKIEKGCSIGEHVHEGKTELHEVINGFGVCTIGDKEYVYNPGDTALIMHDIMHKVEAGEKGLFLLAKFIPALV